MTDEVILYYNPMSRAQIAHYMLEETGAPYRIELLNLQKGEHKTEKFLALNPMGKLPTIVHRDHHQPRSRLDLDSARSSAMALRSIMRPR